MGIRVTHPSGSTIEFPDGTDESTVSRVMQQFQPSQPKPKAEPDDTSFLGGIAQSIRGKQDPRYQNAPSILEQFDLRLPTLAAGVAGASDEQLADILQKQLGDKFVRRGKDANGNTLFVTRRDDGSEQVAYLNKPGLDRNDIGRGVAGAIPYIASGAGAAALGVGRSLLANVGLQAAAGGATSVAGDLASSAMGSDQGIEGGKAALATGFSAAGPVVGRAAGNAYQFARDRIGALPQALEPFGRGSVNRVAEVIQDDRLLPVDLTRQARELGPQGMLADMGDNLRETTGTLARVPGQNKTIVKDAVVIDRRSGAPTRIRDAVNQTVGQEGNVTAFVEAQRAARNQQAAPLYDAFHKVRIPDNPKLNGIIERIRRTDPQVFTTAQRLAQRDQVDPSYVARFTDDYMTPMTGVQKRGSERVWQGAELDYIKRAVDDVAASYPPRSNEQRQMANYARALRETVDEIISPNDPKQSIWAQARAITGEGFEAEDALDQGRNVFSSKRDPFETQAQLNDLSAFGRDVFLRGARDDIRRTMGRASSAYGTTGDAAARRQFQNDFNKENLALVAGQRNADRLSRTIDNETEFARTYDAVQGNSATSAREAAKKKVPGALTAESNVASEAGKKGPVGLATEYAFKFVDALTNGALERRNEVLRTGMARLLTLRGPERDAAIAALNQMRAQRGVNADVARAIDRTINALSIGARGPAMSVSRD